MSQIARAVRPAALLSVLALALPAAAHAAAGPPRQLAPGAPGLTGPATDRFKNSDKTPAADQYIVQLDAPPVATYRGGAQGFNATAPDNGAKVSPDSASAKAWASELSTRQDRVLAAAAPNVKPSASYRYAFAGFAAQLTPDQAAAVAKQPGVAHVSKEQFWHTLQDQSSDLSADAAGGGLAGSEAQLMGLPGGIWKTLGGPAKAGQGVIIGDVDSGITPESASFKDRGLPAPASWSGACEAGDAFPVTSCSNKLIGARYFVDGYGRDHLDPADYLSPRDATGHGTHTAGIAAGDNGVDPLVDGNPLGVGTIAGAAPGAYLAVYKACWGLGDCSTVDIVSAIDAAVADGVDVINLSLGGPHDPGQHIDPVEQATLNADKAGVFVAAAAGNAGSFPDAVGSPATAPWVTAVAATTGSRTFRSTLTVSAAGKTVTLPSSTSWKGFSNAPLFDARAAAPNYDGDPFSDPRYCVAGLTKAQVQGKLVVCDAFAPTEVVNETLIPLGATGVILAGGGDHLQDPVVPSALPTAVIERHEIQPLRDVTNAGGGNATLNAPAATSTPWTADEIAGFSSRGPSTAAGELLRPDVSAPGVNTVAAYAPNTVDSSYQGEGHTPFQVLSGTSMATPEVAGAAALLTQAHPLWTPAQMRSAFVTTALPVTDQGAPASHLAAGSGRIDPTRASDPGLVIAPSGADYDAYAADQLKARDLNLPSVQIDDVQGTATVQRTVSSVAATRTQWSVTIEGQQFNSNRVLSVSPSRFTIAPGAAQPLSIEADDYEGAPAYQDFTVVLSEVGGTRTVRVPVSVHNPGVVNAPAQIGLDANGQAAGTQNVTVSTGGTVRPIGYGFAAPKLKPGLKTKGTPGFEVEQSYTLPLTLAKATQMVSVALSKTKGSAEEPYIGIYRDVDGDGKYTPVDQYDEVDQPRQDDYTSADALDLPAGKYLINVGAYSPDGTPMTFDLRTWTVNDAKPNNPNPAPGLVVSGATSNGDRADRTFGFAWNGVSGTEPLRGFVRWLGQDDATQLATSVVSLKP